ncbi:unnamed protein product [Paramecium sonneborni]|uniref:Transmembrane protein n=1 Tax=Paramecium sonneborni TaxID=65129 RepID=A0A8S1N3Z1_9CILI|nr:unnamed protein product [Paramecium sonneborni]
MDLGIQINTLNQIDQLLNLNGRNQQFLEQNHQLYKQLGQQIYVLLTILEQMKNDRILTIGFTTFVILLFIFFILSAFIRIQALLLGICISYVVVFCLVVKRDHLIQYIQYYFHLINKQIVYITKQLELLKMKEIYYKFYRTKYQNRIIELQQEIQN